MRKTMKNYWLITLLLIISLMVSSCGFLESNAPITTPEINEEIETSHEEQIPEYPDPIEIVISAVGDIMVHKPQITAQYNSQTKEYDFTNNFQFVKPYFQQADLVLGNLETTFAGEERGYSGYPAFNAPDALADALKDAGFDVIATANNHTIDTGSKGMLRTIDVLKDRGFGVIGTRNAEEEEKFIIKEVEGMKLGLTAYTYETPRSGEFKTLNGIRVPKDVENLINSFSYDNIEEDLSKMKETINRMKDQDVDAIIFFMHWGGEYQRQPNQQQRYIAEKLSDYGVDIIFGSHPHVLQPIEIIESQVSNSQTLVVYSMGNFISNQRHETLQNRYTEDGMIVNVKIKKDFEKDLVTLEDVSYVPTWVHRYHANGRSVYEIVPVVDGLIDTSSYNLNGDALWRIENSKNSTVELIESVNNSTSIEVYLVEEKEAL